MVITIGFHLHATLELSSLIMIKQYPRHLPSSTLWGIHFSLVESTSVSTTVPPIPVHLPTLHPYRIPQHGY